MNETIENLIRSVPLALGAATDVRSGGGTTTQDMVSKLLGPDAQERIERDLRVSQMKQELLEASLKSKLARIQLNEFEETGPYREKERELGLAKSEQELESEKLKVELTQEELGEYRETKSYREKERELGLARSRAGIEQSETQTLINKLQAKMLELEYAEREKNIKELGPKERAKKILEYSTYEKEVEAAGKVRDMGYEYIESDDPNVKIMGIMLLTGQSLPKPKGLTYEERLEQVKSNSPELMLYDINLRVSDNYDQDVVKAMVDQYAYSMLQASDTWPIERFPEELSSTLNVLRKIVSWKDDVNKKNIVSQGNVPSINGDINQKNFVRELSNSIPLSDLQGMEEKGTFDNWVRDEVMIYLPNLTRDEVKQILLGKVGTKKINLYEKPPVTMPINIGGKIYEGALEQAETQRPGR